MSERMWQWTILAAVITAALAYGSFTMYFYVVPADLAESLPYFYGVVALMFIAWHGIDFATKWASRRYAEPSSEMGRSGFH